MAEAHNSARTIGRNVAKAVGLALAAVVLLVTDACGDGDPGKSLLPDEVIFPGSSWQRRSPADVGLDAEKLKQIAAYLQGRGMIVRNGYEVFTWGDVARAADVASAVKPFYTHFLVHAVESGRLKGFDETLATFDPRIGALNEHLDFKDRQITFRHCANQVSCYGVSERPGAAYDYNDFQMALFFDTLFLKVYGASFDLVDAQVMTPLLAQPLECQDRPSFMAFGTRDRPGRLKISPRDFCRFGLLYLRGGAWRNRQIVSADHVQLVNKSPLPLTIPRTQAKAADMLSDQRSIGSRRIPDDQTDHFGSYSWAWWVNGKRRSGRLMWPAAPPHVYACLGHAHGKRGMAVVPAWDIVLSWNDTALDRKPWPDQQTDPHPLNEVFRLLDQALAGPDE